RFRRQHPIGSYIADFACLEKRLVVEVDGSQHAEPTQAAHDTRRTRWLESEGYRVVRVWTNEVLENLDGVTEQIRVEALRLPSVRKRSPPPSRAKIT
ncbi:MAG TPA: endonuclease domain-containing protein, partial [Hyphomicrobiaceae bacterium]|nr:endonuclease domain-containing protein [Hyphomicrobiaceae bacterium]